MTLVLARQSGGGGGASGGVTSWVTVTTTTQQLVVNTGYVINNASKVVLTLPLTARVGDTIQIRGLGSGGWRIGQNAGQIIHFDEYSTTTGVLGVLDSINTKDSIELTCIVANTTWEVADSEGDININTSIGVEQNSRRNGITKDYITDKSIYNSRILGNANTTEGSIRVVSNEFQIYLNSAWQAIVTNFRFRETTSGTVFEHKPVGYNTWIEIMSGNSMGDLGANGIPLVQQYVVSMGSHPSRFTVQLDGGTF